MTSAVNLCSRRLFVRPLTKLANNKPANLILTFANSLELELALGIELDALGR